MNNSLVLEASEEEASNATSEEDFWVSYEKVSDMQSPNTAHLPDLYQLPDSAEPQYPDKHRLRQLLDSREDSGQSKLDKSLNILRAAKRVEVRNASLLARTQAKVCVT